MRNNSRQLAGQLAAAKAGRRPRRKTPSENRMRICSPCYKNNPDLFCFGTGIAAAGLKCEGCNCPITAYWVVVRP